MSLQKLSHQSSKLSAFDLNNKECENEAFRPTIPLLNFSESILYLEEWLTCRFLSPIRLPID